MNQPLDDLPYLQQAKAHADEGVIGNVAAVCILGIAELATLRCRRMAQTIYLPNCVVDTTTTSARLWATRQRSKVGAP